MSNWVLKIQWKCFEDLCYSEKCFVGDIISISSLLSRIIKITNCPRREMLWNVIHSPVSYCSFLSYLFLMQSLTRPLAQGGGGNVKLSLQNPFSSCLSSFPGPSPVALMTRWTHWSGFLGHFQGYQQPKPILFFSNLCVHVWGTEPTRKVMESNI